METPNIVISEVGVNVDRGYRFFEVPPYETFTDNRADLFRSLQREYGRCTSKMYREVPGGKDVVCGWVFEKRMKYEDARTNRPEDYYTREVWVEIHENLN